MKLKPNEFHLEGKLKRNRVLVFSAIFNNISMAVSFIGGGNGSISGENHGPVASH